MPRNGLGVFSLPAGTAAVPNTTIKSADYNSALNDLAADMNTPRPIVAGGTGASTAGAALAALGGQPKDDTLTRIAALGTTANKFIYTTGVDTWAEAAITSFGRSLLDDADAATACTTLGLGSAAQYSVSINPDLSVFGGNLPTRDVVKQAIAAIPDGIGIGQSWYDVTASRVGNTVYTNSTGRPIYVAMVTTGNGTASVYVTASDGTTWIKVGRATGRDDGHSVAFVVPNGASYKVNDAAVESWAELR